MVRKCPPQLSRTLILYLSLVRPYVSVLTSFVFGPQAAKVADDHFFCYMGDPLDTNDFTGAIAAITSKPVHQGGIDVRLTMRSLRHFESAILNSEWLKPSLEPYRSVVGDLLSDLQAGHTSDTADRHYGVITHRLPHLRMNDVTGYIAVSTVLHKWWGLLPQDTGLTIQLRRQESQEIPPSLATVAPTTVSPHTSTGPSGPSDLANILLSRLEPAIHAAARESASEAAASLTRTFLPKKPHFPATQEGGNWSPPTVECLLSLRSLTGNPKASFRSPEQALAVQHVLERKGNLLLITPTGHGKSLAFLLPMLMDRRSGKAGLNVIVAPYVLLCNELRDRASSAGLSSLMYDSNLDLNHVLDLDCLVCTPDAVGTSKFMELVTTMSELGKLARVFVDEVHHVLHSSDFRPAFARLSGLRESPVPIVMLTATLPPKSVPALMDSLSLTCYDILRTSGSRPNIRIAITRLSLDSTPLSFISHLVGYQSKLQDGEKGMIFCGTVAEVDLLASQCPYLTKCHSQMPAEEQRRSLARFANRGGPSVMVATSMLGNGLDVPDVRFVLHYGSPRSVVDYIQESGRAGRGGKASSSHIFAFLSREGNVIHPQSQGLGTQEMRRWVQEDSQCRRWGLSLANDGRGETCTSLPGSLLCDVCDSHVSRTLSRGCVSPENSTHRTLTQGPSTVQHHRPPLLLEPPRQNPHQSPVPSQSSQSRRDPAAALQTVPRPPAPHMDLLIDQQVHLGHLRDADSERGALIKVLDTLLERGSCIGCWCHGREGHCGALSCVSPSFFSDHGYLSLKRAIKLPKAHCWFCGFTQASVVLATFPSPQNLIPF